MLREARIAFVAQAKSDVKTYLHHTADEFFTYDFLTDVLETKETARKALTAAAAAAKKDSSIREKLPDTDGPPELRGQETLVIAGDTAILIYGAEISSDGKSWVLVRSTGIWIYRDGRWQLLTGYSVARKRDTPAK